MFVLIGFQLANYMFPIEYMYLCAHLYITLWAVLANLGVEATNPDQHCVSTNQLSITGCQKQILGLDL